MKRGRVKGGSIIPATIDTGRRTRSSMAQPVFNAAGLTRGLQGGAAENVIVITSADLKQNGGNYSLIGGPPIPMEIVTGRRSKQGAATVVYPVDLDGNYDPSFAGYIHKVLNPDPESGYDPSSLIGFWPQNEASGGVSFDHSGLDHHGAYTGVTLGQPGVPGMGMTSPFYDGANDFNNIYSLALNAAINGSEGTLLQWAKVNSAAEWTDGVQRFVCNLTDDVQNRIMIRKSAANNNVDFLYEAGNILELHSEGGITSVNWMVVALTWSAADDEVNSYIDAVLLNTDVGLGVWAGGGFGATTTVIGAEITTPATVWHGNIGPSLLYAVALTQPAIAYLSTP